MWLAVGLGLIGIMWFVGAVITPDKNGPTVFGHDKAKVEVSRAAQAPAPPPPQP